MSAPTDAASHQSPARLVYRYYLAMSVPFLIDAVSVLVYAALNSAPEVVLPSLAITTLFLAGGVGFGAWLLVRPIRHFIVGRAAFGDIELSLARLPRHSATVVGMMYAPMVALRLLSHRLEITFGATLQQVAWPDVVANLTVGTGFNVVLTFFVVAAYLDHLCQELFRTKGVNIGTFGGRFRSKVALALLFVSFATMVLIAADMLSYSGERLVREASSDITTSAIGTAFMYYWISNALTRPITRLDGGLRRVADNDYTVRLPVTSDDELGHAASRFNQMVEGLAEKAYLRDTFGKYVSETVADSILSNRGNTGRSIDTTAEATLMFTDIEGFTGLSESTTPAEVAALLNAYLHTVVPVIQRHGGIVNSFIGDGLFVSFGLPRLLENHARAAIAAAIDIQKALATARFARGFTLPTRIGLNTGPVIGVTIGTDNRLSYTLLGDAVNVAARLEQLNKKFGTRILATESTVVAAGAETFCERLGTTDVRGHHDGVVIYHVGQPL
ncbi:MAG: adenylate/guanylate cyclase domain-containing protein [Reyranella sp.]|uniref:adenylate/guanylate cyclase domain-containing protein n=1 Tax=Reyranella sp. TaxID=1929291 RepID=UPI001207B993|nr:adenylate/guanylate cyclase domain-containing protein [Reyranella sp.]TAJ97256.1 MAG: adenylate/guanylate cyclase domain-containing protein [Reyranella sp.]TBR24101.1 MAG: adenylate/guanylate cyclase domain-containing protein [Reyranella sp.]